MIRMLVLSVLVCLSTVGGVYGAVTWKEKANGAAGKDAQEKFQILKTRMVSVPVLSEGQLLGYVVTRLQFTADPEQLKASSVQPEAFVADEAFRLIYETSPNEIKTGRKRAMRELADKIVAGANRRLGRDVVKDVMVDSWTYLSKQDMRKQ